MKPSASGVSLTAGSTIHQYLAAFSVNIISITYGTLFGWSSASLLDLQADDSPLETGPLTNAEEGWVGSVLCIGAIVGTIFFSWFAGRIGKKFCLMIMTVLALMSWIVIVWAKNPFQLCIARLIGGTLGSVPALVPIYVTEISEIRVRGTLGSLIIPSVNVGILIAYILGNFYPYAATALLLVPVPLIFLVAFLKFPETPQFLIKKGKVWEAEASLHFYRNTRDHYSEDFRLEFEKLKAEHSKAEIQISWKDFNNRIARKALLISITLTLLSQLCGSLVLMNYTATIFEKSGTNLSPKLTAIIVAIIMLLGSCVATFLVECAGRKILLTISSIGTGIGLVSLGTFEYLTALGCDTEGFNWVPLTSFAITIFLVSLGLEPLPFLIVTEILPLKIRNIGNMICVTLFWLTAFLIFLFFPILIEFLGMYGVMFIFSGFSFFGAIFIKIFVPETKGKTLEEIHLML